MKWFDYSQYLVRRDEILLGFDVINNWNTELKKINKDKVGLGAISYLILFFSCLAMLRCTFICHMDKPRVLHKDMLKGKVPLIQDYTTISRRINRLNIEIKNTNSKEFQDDYIVIAIDSTVSRLQTEVNG